MERKRQQSSILRAPGSKVHWNNLPRADATTDRPEQDGSSERGEEFAREMDRPGMFVDLSHVSPATILDALRVSHAPVLLSNSNARAVAGHVRNVPDEVLRRGYTFSSGMQFQG